MEFLKTLYDQLVSLLGISQVIDTFTHGTYDLVFIRQITSKLGFRFVLLLIIIEIAHALIEKKWKFSQYQIIFFNFTFNRLLSRIISVGVIFFCIAVFQKYALLKSGVTWYWFIYGYIVWELAHFIYHFLGHKVRLFWCLHATHHSPEFMNISVSHARFFLEGPFSDIIRTTICIVLGVNPLLLFLIMLVDSIWGAFIHIGEHLVKDGRFGFLHKIILTPSHHRVHHARNPLYMDTNFCSLLNIWDRVFKTYQYEKEEIPPEYGITREVNKQSFTDMYFGEFISLGKDIYYAPGIKNKLLYMVMPPGWSHTGEHKTAKHLRDAFIQNQSVQPPQIT